MTEQEAKKVLVNPFYAIEIDPTLALDHEPVISEDLWVKANVQLIREWGPERYLRVLLDALRNPVLNDVTVRPRT